MTLIVLKFTSLLSSSSQLKCFFSANFLKSMTIALLFSISFLSLFSEGIIDFEITEFDFGQIKEENGPFEKAFIFKNVGDAPFSLKNVKAG